MDNFIKYIKENNSEIKPDDANREIINNLMLKDIRQSEKLTDIDAYDSETLFNGKIYRGNIYIFEYESKFPTKYSYNGTDVYFTDTMPICLMIGETPKTIYGINLNFCNKDLRTLILNLITNIDEDFFFNGGDQKLAANKNLVISQKLYKFLSDENAAKIINQFLSKYYKNVDYSFIYRHYAISNIKHMRLIEPWQWKYIPFINYIGSLKKDTLEAIQTLSGVKNIKI